MIVLFYVDKKLLGTKKSVEMDGTLLTMDCELPVFKGQIIFTNHAGQHLVMSEKHFEDNYLEVEKKENKPLSNFTYEQMAAGYQAMAELDPEEDENYIKELKNNLSDKPF